MYIHAIINGFAMQFVWFLFNIIINKRVKPLV